VVNTVQDGICGGLRPIQGLVHFFSERPGCPPDAPWAGARRGALAPARHGVTPGRVERCRIDHRPSAPGGAQFGHLECEADSEKRLEGQGEGARILVRHSGEWPIIPGQFGMPHEQARCMTPCYRVSLGPLGLPEGHPAPSLSGQRDVQD
jgi:hypothetical protein